MRTVQRAMVALGAAALLAVATAPAAVASDHSQVASKAEVKQAVKKKAVIFAKTYARARHEGRSHSKAVVQAQQAMFTKGTTPSYTVDGERRSYQSTWSDIPGDTSRAYISLQPNFYMDGTRDAGPTYCLAINLNALANEYVPSAVGKPKLGYTTSSRGCQPAAVEVRGLPGALAKIPYKWKRTG